MRVILNNYLPNNQTTIQPQQKSSFFLISSPTPNSSIQASLTSPSSHSQLYKPSNFHPSLLLYKFNMISSIEQAANNIPLLSVHAGPKDEKWRERLKQELKAIITYVKANKQQDNDWFKIEPSKDGVKWQGVCSCTHNLVRYEFRLQFQIPATYPSAPIELELPELQGKTIKMYRGGKICQDIHFAPLWAKHSPKLGIAHALAMALGPWLAAEVPNMVKEGKLIPK